jgi:aryl-alcohol dehydrogenase-like predicted oxidoreductase
LFVVISKQQGNGGTGGFFSQLAWSCNNKGISLIAASIHAWGVLQAKKSRTGLHKITHHSVSSKTALLSSFL